MLGSRQNWRLYQRCFLRDSRGQRTSDDGTISGKPVADSSQVPGRRTTACLTRAARLRQLRRGEALSGNKTKLGLSTLPQNIRRDQENCDAAEVRAERLSSGQHGPPGSREILADTQATLLKLEPATGGQHNVTNALGPPFCLQIAQQRIKRLTVRVVILPSAEIRDEIFTNFPRRILAGVRIETLPALQHLKSN